MIKSTSLVFLFLISLASTAQISNTIFPNNVNQQKRISTSTSNQRTAAANKQRLDSIVSPFGKYVFMYDAAGNVTFDALYQRNTATDPWIPIFKTEYGYDAAGNTILIIKHFWDDATNVFFPDNKYESEYDVNKNQTSEITYSWNSSNNTWFPAHKFENMVGSNGQISTTHNYYWAGTVLMADNYIEFTYNSKKLLVEEIQYNLADVVQNQKTYTYDTNDNLISTINASGGYLGNKSEYTYDSQNNVILSLQSEWSEGVNDWEMVYKTEYEFDLQNNQSAIIQSDWDTQTNMWTYSYKNVYSYDNTYAITDLIMPDQFDETLKHKLTNFVSYNFNDDDWELAQEYTVYYTNVTTIGIANRTSNALTVYPNPANDRVVFTNKTSDAATLELFNQQGRLVYKNAIVMNQPVSVEELIQGIYFYRISGTNYESYNGTLIIE